MSAVQLRRLPEGGEIDRSRSLRFHFNGRALEGHPSDTLASALLANGVRMVARSFKYHRPRGIVTAGAEEPNAIVQLEGDDDEPNVRATTLALREGMRARSVNCWPNLRCDLGALNERLSGLFAAGFYYKTFIGPPGDWNLYGPLIRRMAGLGHAPRRPVERNCEKRFHHCDVLVAGAGPAGLAAALAAARGGARVLLADDAVAPGGVLRESACEIDGRTGRDWAESVAAELDACPGVLRLPSATVAGGYDHNLYTIVERRPAPSFVDARLWKVRARRVVLATGASERALVFADNDRPGVMTPSAALAYLVRYAVCPGQRAVAATNNSSTYRIVRELVTAGLEVAALADARAHPPAALVRELEALGVEVFPASAVVCAHGARGVRAAEFAPIDRPGDGRRLACDLVLCSGGWDPRVHLHSHSGGRPRYRPELACFVPGESAMPQRSVGAANGVFALRDCLREGWRAGVEACRALGLPVPDGSPPECPPEPPLGIEPLWEATPPTARRRKAFVDLQNDVTTGDIRQSVQEGFRSVEHVKRYTTAGMGTDQGKLGNVNTIGVLSDTLSLPPGAVGTTTYRPPYTPIDFDVIAGRERGELVSPSRRTALTDWIENAGAVMFEAGAGYRRPLYFPRNGEDMAAAVAREVRACRTSAGLYDGSPLGKLGLHGPDAVTFLNRIHANRFEDLEIGRGRFGWMLREDGRLLDDAVTFRLGDERYLMFVGTGAAGHVEAHLERLLQIEWPSLGVFLTVVTAQWTNICLCGPRARDVLESAGVDGDIGPRAFPFMTMRDMHVAGFPARVARAGYTGELSFEINVRAREGRKVWEALLRAGEPHGLTLVGSEASMVMRCEKGFVSAGFEGDGIVNPFDAGYGWAVDMSKEDFIGRRSLVRDANAGGVRPQSGGPAPGGSLLRATGRLAAGRDRGSTRVASRDRLRVAGLPQPERGARHRPRGARRRPAAHRGPDHGRRARAARGGARHPALLRGPRRRADEGLGPASSWRINLRSGRK